MVRVFFELRKAWQESGARSETTVLNEVDGSSEGPIGSLPPAVIQRWMSASRLCRLTVKKYYSNAISFAG